VRVPVFGHAAYVVENAESPEHAKALLGAALISREAHPTALEVAQDFRGRWTTELADAAPTVLDLDAARDALSEVPHG